MCLPSHFSRHLKVTMDDECLIVIALALTLPQPRKRTTWSKDWYLKRQSLSHCKLTEGTVF